MVKHSNSGATRPGNRLVSFYPRHRSVLSLAIATALALPASVYAQEQTPAADTALEEVVVTGIRAGIEDAIAIKQESMSIVEAISAEDIGKLPDTSIAESISRLPGLTSQRAEGRASAISLRGTDPGFTTALLNGREQVSTGDNRSIEFEQYPSELMSSVVVYKTPDAQLDRPGPGRHDRHAHGASARLRQARPIVFNLRGEMNSQRRPRRRFRRQGLPRQLLLRRPVHGRHARSGDRLRAPRHRRWRRVAVGTYEPWHPSDGGGGTPGDDSPNWRRRSGRSAGRFRHQRHEGARRHGRHERDGFMGALECEPNDTYTSIARCLLLDDEAGRQRAQPRDQPRRLPGPLLRRHLPGRHACSDTPNPTIKTTPSSPATLNNVVPLARNFLFKTEDEILAAGLAQRIHAIGRVVNDRRHQLLECQA